MDFVAWISQFSHHDFHGILRCRCQVVREYFQWRNYFFSLLGSPLMKLDFPFSFNFHRDTTRPITDESDKLMRARMKSATNYRRKNHPKITHIETDEWMMIINEMSRCLRKIASNWEHMWISHCLNFFFIIANSYVIREEKMFFENRAIKCEENGRIFVRR